MKKLLGTVLFSLLTSFSFSQECDSLVNVCYDYLKQDCKPGKMFISDGQVYQAFVAVEQSAEFKVTLFGGTLYRIAATAGVLDDYVIFNVRDEDGNILFSNEDFKNKPYWDFQVESTVDCYIEAYLDMDKKISGCLVLLLGFQR
jgi:hypothetical protein